MTGLLSSVPQSKPVLPAYCLLGSAGVSKIPWQKLAEQFVIVSDTTVAALYGDSVTNQLQQAGVSAEIVSFPAGERDKTRETKAKIEDALLGMGLGRQSCLIALGGGVTLDVVGFVAATYCRGVPLVLFPTTFLAMVDACIGGKTAVNTAYGKNLIGAFYPPAWVWIDPSFLQTLPEEDWKNGWAEILKTAAVLSVDFFLELEHLSIPLTQLHLLEPIIAQSCALKSAVVTEDVYDQGKRRLLNFGHTIGHGLEAYFSYQMPHGQAVAIGMLLEGHIAVQKGHLPLVGWERLHALCVKYGISLQLPTLPDLETLFLLMCRDKKNRASKEPRCIILQDIGQPAVISNEYLFPISFSELSQAIIFYANTIV